MDRTLSTVGHCASGILAARPPAKWSWRRPGGLLGLVVIVLAACGNARSLAESAVEAPAGCYLSSAGLDVLEDGDRTLAAEGRLEEAGDWYRLGDGTCLTGDPPLNLDYCVVTIDGRAQRLAEVDGRDDAATDADEDAVPDFGIELGGVDGVGDWYFRDAGCLDGDRAIDTDGLRELIRR